MAIFHSKALSLWLSGQCAFCIIKKIVCQGKLNGMSLIHYANEEKLHVFIVVLLVWGDFRCYARSWNPTWGFWKCSWATLLPFENSVGFVYLLFRFKDCEDMLETCSFKNKPLWFPVLSPLPHCVGLLNSIWNHSLLLNSFGRKEFLWNAFVCTGILRASLV